MGGSGEIIRNRPCISRPASEHAARSRQRHVDARMTRWARELPLRHCQSLALSGYEPPGTKYAKRLAAEKKAGGSGWDTIKWKQNLYELMNIEIARSNYAMLMERTLPPMAA